MIFLSVLSQLHLGKNGGGGCGIQLDESIIHVTVSHFNDFTFYLTTRTQVQSHSYAHEYKKK